MPEKTILRKPGTWRLIIIYKPAFPVEKALSIIEEGKGTQFDPKCVEVFMDSLDEVMVVLNKYNKEA